ncbi:unnamed protein product, partial [marine sediment metagenome]
APGDSRGMRDWGRGGSEAVATEKNKIQRVDLKFQAPDEVSSRKLRVKAGDGTLAKAEAEYREGMELPWDSQAGVEEGDRAGSPGRGIAYVSLGALALLCAGVVWMMVSSKSGTGMGGLFGGGSEREGAGPPGGGGGDGTGLGEAGGAGMEQNDFYVFANETKGEAVSVLEKFLRAPTFEERLRYVHHPERAQALAETSARYRSDEPFLYRTILKDKVSVVKGRPTILVDLEMHDYTTKQVALHYGQDGYRVDWEWFVEYGETSWVDFTTRKSTEPLMFRVHASKDNYFNFS